jgi:3D (Asp-Asp-Asp) domain-containing protein
MLQSRRDAHAQQVAAVVISAMAVLITAGSLWLLGVHTGTDAGAGAAPLLAVDARQIDTRTPQTALSQATAGSYEARPVAAVPLPAPAGPPMFNGRPIRPVKTLRMKVTAYSPDKRSCGRFADNTTASGYSVWTNGMRLVAADTRILKFGSLVSVPGYDGGRPAPVLDRGGKIKGRRLDVLYPTHEMARRWGVRTLEVTIWQYADRESQAPSHK